MADEIIRKNESLRMNQDTATTIARKGLSRLSIMKANTCIV